MNILLIYSSTDGHTKKICEVIKNSSINKKAFKIIPIDKSFQINLRGYDKIIIGASIRYGRHNSKIQKFLKKNKDIIDSKKNAFFSVNVVARKPEKNTPDSNPYVKKFLKKTNWQPSIVGVFAGKIDYPKLSFINRHIIRFIMFMTNGPTDTNKVYEFTDWELVKKFVKKFDNLII
tara:strand:+ start:80 stop:607 length:528 start_codon:yes stop_codon:yes gene_type:complete